MLDIDWNNFQVKILLTNRFYVAMHLLSNRSKCGENERVGHQPIGKFVTDVLPHFDVCFDLFLNRAQQDGIFMCQFYIKKK